ncbi:V-type ATP synthase subunit F [Treponema sp.]|uniref:V-type ATP synthase subunit F n=1 Tax=Treponema sp. TaxID=166 RepID=UPI003F014439
MEYFVIGERELILGFMLAGVKGKSVSNRQEALDAFNKATGQNSSVGSVGDIPKVLILTEDVADMLSSEIQSWQMGGKAPLIVEIPGLQGHIQGRKTLTDSIREAVGIQV